jgi:hypothetical protein
MPPRRENGYLIFSPQCFDIGKYDVMVVMADEKDKGVCPYFYISEDDETFEQIEITMNCSYSEKINQFILNHFCALNFLWYGLWITDDFADYFRLISRKKEKRSVEEALYEVCKKEKEEI